jgi:hypothetical protein
VCPFFSPFNGVFFIRISETIIIVHYKVRITQHGINLINEILMDK